MFAIKTENISKSYKIRHQNGSTRYKTLQETIINLPRALFRKSTISEKFQALNDVSFEIQPGERVGIIGRNGAGKSTLLKVLSRITEPTNGRVLINGRVASLLEVGTGFHPELTGRENVFMNGAILGMSRAEIKKKFDEIVNFAEVEQFIDTPVKRYSSGMYVRLAFAVAAHLEPEILLIDEVLAVGDIQFQKKCLGKMEHVSNENGRTILFVSHDMGAISKLCSKAILLNNGCVAMNGEINQVVASYFNTVNVSAGNVYWEDPLHAPGDAKTIYCRSIGLYNGESENCTTLYAEDEFYITIEYEIVTPLSGIWIGFSLSTLYGQIVFCSGDTNVGVVTLERKKGIYESKCTIPANLLNQGEYFVDLLAHKPGEKILFDEKQVIKFEVLQKVNRAGYGKQPGLIRPELAWKINQIK